MADCLTWRTDHAICPGASREINTLTGSSLRGGWVGGCTNYFLMWLNKCRQLPCRGSDGDNGVEALKQYEAKQPINVRLEGRNDCSEVEKIIIKCEG